MKKFQISPATESRFYWVIVIMMTLTFAFATVANSQNVTRKGNQFEQVSKTKKEPVKTKYTYRIKDSVYVVYLSPSGKAFILRRSHKTGKEYRMYLPEVTKQLNKGNYEN